MKKRIFSVLLPVLMGGLITAIFLVLPARASQPPNLLDPAHGWQHIYGTIDSFPQGLIGEWIVNSTPYTADNHTIFHQDHGSFAVGACVGVEYTDDRQPGSFRAIEIQTEYAYKCTTPPNPVSEANGIVITFPVNLVGTWVVNTATYTATDSTRFEQDAGPFVVGGCVDVKYISATHQALEISTIDREGCGGEGEQEFFGLISQAPPTGTITSTWVISGVDFISTPSTYLDTRHGPLVVGACAKVDYRVTNGQNVADVIASQWAFRCIGFDSFNQVSGSVVSFPPDLFGTWVISPTHTTPFTFVTDPATHFVGRFWDISIGSCVHVIYYTQAGVNHAVLVIASEDHHCGHGQASTFSKLIAAVGVRPPTDTLTGTWIMAGVPFTATAATHFDEGGSNLNVGDCAESSYDPASGAMLLKHVEAEEGFECKAQDGSDLFKLFGFIDTLPGGGVLTGTWQVSGVSLEAISTTLFNQDHGAFAPGAFVAVTFTYDAGAGLRTATKIETHVAPGDGRENHRGHVEHIQKAASPNDYDRWTVDGVVYLADPAMQTSPGLAVGSLVTVNAYQSNGNLFATRISGLIPVYLPPIINH